MRHERRFPPIALLVPLVACLLALLGWLWDRYGGRNLWSFVHPEQ